MHSYSSRVLCNNNATGGAANGPTVGCNINLPPELEGNELLKNIEPRMIELIMNEVSITISPVPQSPIDYGSWLSNWLGRHCWASVCQRHHQRDCSVANVETVCQN